MFERLRVVVLVLVLVSGVDTTAGASPTSPAPTSAPMADPCATAVPDLPNDLQSAFAYEIKSAAVLRFLSQIKRVPERAQRQIFDRAVAAAKTPAQRELELAEQRVCPTAEEIYGQTRALILVANEWTPRNLQEDDKFSAFSGVVGDAITALVLGDELSVDQRQDALTPFAALAEISESARPQEIGSGACTQPATTIRSVRPSYPPLAGVSGTTGRVNVVITLNERGDVRTAKPIASTLGDRPGAADLVNAAILSAAASSYAPEIRDCKGVKGTYVFAVEFNRR